MRTAVGIAPTRVRTAPLVAGDSLLDRLPTSTGALSWVRRGHGLVGWGEAARLEVSGPDRFAQAAEWWHQVAAEWSVEDELGLPGCGPVAFGSFAFDDDGPTSSVLVVPEVLVGRRGDTTWLTTIGGRSATTSVLHGVEAPRGLRYSGGTISVTAFRQAVEAAVSRIRSGALDKVVLAHDLIARADDDIDARFVLRGLADRYPDCWTFAVDGLVGATPELLVQRSGDEVLSRVLAGTAARGADAADDESLRAGLLRSGKDLEEHRFAVESVTSLLTPHCADLSVPTAPYVLELPNVCHLASDVTGRLRDGADALELAGALHPTAAVGGTPTDVAMGLRRDLEPMDRGRYAGPVGWVDARGDGEWGIALRCAQLDGRSARLFAGCGIVADSDPDDEVLEAQTKFVPMRDALESVGG
jgi:menaquinone-specific isochorismate synthase